MCKERFSHTRAGQSGVAKAGAERSNPDNAPRGAQLGRPSVALTFAARLGKLSCALPSCLNEFFKGSLERYRLPTSAMIRPTYSERFRCIGPACEDSCCVGWAVPVDKAAYEKYQTVPAGPLRVLLDENIVPIEESATESPTPGHFARIKMPPSLDCPMLTEERLCRIHAELGEEFLCRTCDLFPRIAYTIDSVEERSLALA